MGKVGILLWNGLLYGKIGGLGKLFGHQIYFINHVVLMGFSGFLF